MTRFLSAAFLCVLYASVANPLFAQTSFPMVTHCTPIAVQRGTTAEVTVEGQMNFAGATGFLSDGLGLSAEIAPGPEPKPGAAVRSVKLKVTAAKDAALGAREFRLVTRLGLSTVGQLLVVEDPVVTETG